MQVGERVLAYNPKTGKMEQEPIRHVWINHDSDLVDLTITTTTKGEHGKPATKTSEVIHTNQKHPFFTIEHGFLPVGQIKLGMHLLRADGRVGVVTGWKVVPGTKTMYNLEVAQDHTFTVGSGQWVVHNCPNPNSGPGNPSSPGSSTSSGPRGPSSSGGTPSDPRDLLNDLGPTLERIDDGVPFPHRNDGSTFQNREGLLPSQPTGYYKEYVVPTPGMRGPGPQRIILGQGGEIYYTMDHYLTFIDLTS